MIQFPDNSFRTADGCSDSACVEVSIGSGGVAIRDSKDKPGLMLVFTRHEWDVFTAGVKAGEFD